MVGPFIDSEKIYYTFRSGASAVIQHKRELNNINVFPVPDGDTGTNLAFTMNAILSEAKVGNSAKETMYSIAEAALTGARGNSGIIFAQFMNGIYMALEEQKDISIVAFSSAAKKAISYAYQAVTNPIEGTMLSVMKAWTESLYTLKDQAADFAQLFHASLQVAFEALMNTPNQLKVLKEASVVDSGAKGFIHFLEGATQYLTTLEMNEVAISASEADYRPAVHQLDHIDLTYRYCTEALLEGDGLDLEKIKHSLLDLGDSLIVAGSATKAKVHLHTNSPSLLFDRLRGYGKIISQKADDMVRQYETVHTRKHKIALVTDSIADLPQSIMDYHQIHMLPLNLIIDDSSYLDKTTISPSYLYQFMDDGENYPTSSQPTRKAAKSFLQFLEAHYESIIVITVSQQMSGTYDTFMKAARAIGLDKNKIAIIDSKLNSVAQGLVVLKAAEEIDSGKHFEEVIELVEQTVQNTKIFVSVNTLKYMVRSGRVKKLQGFAAKLFNLKPVVSIDDHGEGMVIGKALSVKGNTKKIQSLVSEMMKTKTIVNYAIVHADAEDRAQQYEGIFTALIGRKPKYTTEISSIVAMNAGIGCVAIAIITE
ncbi:DegV family EDD domain-containing protein [Bacillus sp. FJAT-49732]|uniref:DegV family EDD domain-containing protein n=1 Tax=Lederbergia citrisecunda TaxID=2833583 RepID=A0A942YLY3_9BACI|nr:DegV family protein [Lederbergia citrisecunda]MBS4201137.1 DegV family EDD domain-containing protein [Lederbergia citrisecunda]